MIMYNHSFASRRAQAQRLARSKARRRSRILLDNCSSRDQEATAKVPDREE